MSTYAPIRTLLVANRGEIARRIMRTARAMGITTVAVHSDADRASPHVAEADLAVHLPGDAPGDTYLRSALILDAAARSGADAIHPGYGFLSESGDFARVVTGAGYVWVGPPPAAIDAMGSKIDSKELMRDAGVPTLPSITVEADRLPDIVAVEDLGWPLLVKASAGGGGRGMRVVWGPSELADAVAGARREARSAFGDGTVFLERYLRDPRHIEVQVLADAYGDTVALFERECSIQRRHQKIVEEAPSPFVTPELRSRLVEAAVTAADEVGYVNAGTVEFVVDDDGEPYFLEMNTRLQVEHPVTEAITGLDLVRLQLLIAGGSPLPPEVHAAVAAGPRGHAIEARLYAEDPGHGWMPSTGRLHRFEVGTDSPADEATGVHVRVDSGVESGSDVSPHYDPMLAKVVVHAPTRAEAATTLSRTLARARIHGVTTNRDLLVRVLDHPAFLAGNTDTGFIDRHGLSRLAATLTDREAVRRHALAAALASQAAHRSAARVQPTIPSGYRNNPSSLQQTAYDVGGETVTVGYRFDTRGQTLTAVEVDGAPYEVDTADADPEGATFYADGVGRRYRVDRHGPTIFVDGPDGSSVLHEQLRFPVATDQLAAGSALAPMPGGVVRVAVGEGDTVESGQLLVVLEAMKMEHAVHAGAAGTVTAVEVTEGDQVETGRILVVVEPEGPSGPGDDPDVEDGDAPAGGPNSDGRSGGRKSDGPTDGTAGEGTADGAVDGSAESTVDGPAGAAPDGPTSAGPAGRG
jgi:propionyl-CoA carboxylase alpha chain